MFSLRSTLCCSNQFSSGTVNNIEIFRALLAAGFKPTTPVEIHWYSGEEAGLLGSQDIATSYAKAGAKVKAFLELDMTVLGQLRSMFLLYLPSFCFLGIVSRFTEANFSRLTCNSFEPGSKEVIALEADYIDTGVNTFVKSLVTDYSSLPWAMDTPVSQYRKSCIFVLMHLVRICLQRQVLFELLRFFTHTTCRMV